MKKVIIHNLKAIPKDAAFYWNNNGSGFTKQLEIRKAITAFCEQPGIKKIWLSRKRKSTAAAMKEFKDLYGPKNYFSQFMDGDDVFEVFYTEKIAQIAKSVWTLREALEQSRAALPIAWSQHGPCSDDLLNSIDLALQS